MILAAGLTPAWQQIMCFDQLTVGEVNRAEDVYWCASGKVINVGIALHHLGGNCQTLSIVGGRPGEAICEEFSIDRIKARWVTSSTPTRTCTTILDATNGITTELVENSDPLPEDELQEFREAFAEEAANADVVVLSGSLPAGTPSSMYRDLLEDFQGRAILDVRRDELWLALEHRPFLVKPNREELGQTVGRPLRNDADLIAAMQSLNERGAEWVVVSQGKHTLFVTSAHEVYRLTPPTGQAVNPIACGDCLAAGIGWALGRGDDVLQAVCVGMASAHANLEQLLPARIDRERVLAVADTIEVKRG